MRKLNLDFSKTTPCPFTAIISKRFLLGHGGFLRVLNSGNCLELWITRNDIKQGG